MSSVPFVLFTIIARGPHKEKEETTWQRIRRKN